jgi:hypothetical protein
LFPGSMNRIAVPAIAIAIFPEEASGTLIF